MNLPIYDPIFPHGFVISVNLLNFIDLSENFSFQIQSDYHLMLMTTRFHHFRQPPSIFTQLTVDGKFYFFHLKSYLVMADYDWICYNLAWPKHRPFNRTSMVLKHGSRQGYQNHQRLLLIEPVWY